MAASIGKGMWCRFTYPPQYCLSRSDDLGQTSLRVNRTELEKSIRTLSRILKLPRLFHVRCNRGRVVPGNEILHVRNGRGRVR
jgi:hypothetical protein